MGYAIQLRSISKKYYLNNKIEFKAIDNLSLNIQKGQIVGFLGPNGAGKTTIIKLICNLVTPTDGQIIVNNYDIKNFRNIVMSQIGVVLEGNRNLFWQLTGFENIMYFGRLKGLSKNDLYCQAEKLICELGLENVKNEVINKLSRGDQQKFAIACALIANPDIILLDEPTLGLDLQSLRTLKNWIKSLSQKENKTIILTTNQLDIAEDICDRIVFINKGKLITDKLTSDFLDLFKEDYYKISIAGKIIDNQHLLPGMKIIEKENETILIGSVTDQNELYKKISIIYNSNLPIISINKIKHNLEDIFILLSQK